MRGDGGGSSFGVMPQVREIQSFVIVVDGDGAISF